MSEESYRVRVTFNETQTYIINGLLKTGLYGKNKREIVERIFDSWILYNLDDLERFGIDIQNVRKE